MTPKPPTYRQRAIDTGVNNIAGMRDLIIDLASEIDKMLGVKQSPAPSESEASNQTNENEEK